MSTELKTEDIKKIINRELREYHKLVAHPAEKQLWEEQRKQIGTDLASEISALKQRVDSLETKLAAELKALKDAVIALQTNTLDKAYFYQVITTLQQNLKQMISEVRGFLQADSNEKTGLDKPVSGMATNANLSLSKLNS